MDAKIKTLFVVAVLSTALPATAHAQVSVEGRGSLQRPVGSFQDDANGDTGFAGDAFLALGRNLSLYGGYGLEHLGCDGCSDSDGLTSSGFEVGGKLMANPSAGGVLPWVRVGATLHKLKVDNGPLQATSDRKLGLQASVGLDIPLGRVLSFSPAVRYQAYRAEFPTFDNALVGFEDVRFLTLDFGLHIQPGY